MAQYITEKFFKFFKELKTHNDREWFQENKHRFQDDVQDPLLSFIQDFEPHLHKISPHFKAIAKKNGGSMFRIYRDVRFSNNKMPYKTHAAIHFRHEDGKCAHAPGFYLHLEPNSIFMGAGIWSPEPSVAQKIRLYIADHEADWIKATTKGKFSKNWEINRDEFLKRPPKNIDPDHPLIEDLKLKQFIAGRKLTKKEVMDKNFVKAYAQYCAEANSFMKIISNALGSSY